jgi:hypothetical protein
MMIYIDMWMRLMILCTYKVEVLVLRHFGGGEDSRNPRNKDVLICFVVFLKKKKKGEREENILCQNVLQTHVHNSHGSQHGSLSA